MNEKLIERKLSKGVKALGGLALKFSSPYYTGMPDRLILLAGKAYWVELKTTGKKPTPKQLIRQTELQKLGFVSVIITNQSELDSFLTLLKNERNVLTRLSTVLWAFH